MRNLRLLFLSIALLSALIRSADAQAVRYDTLSSTTSAQCAPGKQCPINALPGTQVNICGGTVTTLASCLASPATTYASAATTPCATTAQLTPATGGACLATADNQGAYGFWILPGSYNYFLRVPATAGGGTYGPYPLSLGASAGCPLGAVCDANFSTLPLACSAAGTGTLYITRAWNGLATANYCPLANPVFLGNGKVQPASGNTVTLPAWTLCPPVQPCFDTSAGGTIAFSSAPSSITPMNFGAKNDGSTDDTTKIQAAINATCRGAGAGAVIFPAGAGYKFTAALTYTSQYCTWDGDNRGGSILLFTPGSAGIDGVTFIHSGIGQFANRLAHLTITANNTNVRRLVSLGTQTDFSADDVTINGQQATVALYMVGMQTSSFHHILVGGPNSGTGDAILIDTSPTSTTVVFDSETDIEGSFGGACLHAKGGSGATNITFADSTAENCIYGIEAETGMVLHHNHIEFSHSNSILVPTGASALIQSDNNNFQQCGGFPTSTFFSLTSATSMYSANDVTDLAAGCTLFAAPTGSKVYTSGPQFPYGIFPEGTLNSGDPNAISAGVLSNQSFTATGVSGDFRAQLFRGNFYNVGIQGDTAIHVIGASNHIPAGETIMFHLTRNSSAVASTNNSLTNDIPIVGQINANGTAANSYQDVLLRMDTSGNLVVESSPGWTTLTNGTGFPTIGNVGSFTPHISFSGSNVGVVEQFHSGTYIKIGKQVFVNLFLILSAKGSASGVASITGLPFTNGSSRSDGGFVYFYSALSGITAMPSGTMPASGTTVFLYRPSSAALDDTNFTNTSEINFSITYQADQ